MWVSIRRTGAKETAGETLMGPRAADKSGEDGEREPGPNGFGLMSGRRDSGGGVVSCQGGVMGVALR